MTLLIFRDLFEGFSSHRKLKSIIKQDSDISTKALFDKVFLKQTLAYTPFICVTFTRGFRHL